jgi:hypothetical protein
MWKRILTVLVLVIFAFHLSNPKAFSEIWRSTGPEKAGIMSALPAEYRDYAFVYGCDYESLRDELIPAMEVSADTANHTIAVAIGYVMSLAATGLVAIQGSASAAAGARTVISSTSKWELARAAAEKSSQINWLNAVGMQALLSIVGADISTWIAGGTAADYKKQCDRLKNELGISDYFGFACVVKSSMASARSAILPWEGVNLPLGAPMKISVLPSASDSNPPPPLIVVKNPKVNFARLGSSLQEWSLTGQARPVTVPFVFAYEKFKGQILRRQDGNPSIRVAVVKGDGLKGKMTGEMNLSAIPQLGTGGLRELHLSSPINMGMLCKKFNDGLGLALVVNNETVAVHGPAYPAPLGSNLKIAVMIKGFHDNHRDVQVENGRTYSWKSITDGVLRRFSCQGAGISNTNVQDMGNYAELWCKPTKPGKVSVVAATMDGNVIFPNVATVGGSPIEGLWKVRGNESVIRIVYVPNSNTFRGILEVDHLQHINQGDIIWDPIKPDPATPDVYKAVEHMSDGRGSMTSTTVTLQTRNGILIYVDGTQTRYLDPISEKNAEKTQ